MRERKKGSNKKLSTPGIIVVARKANLGIVLVFRLAIKILISRPFFILLTFLSLSNHNEVVVLRLLSLLTVNNLFSLIVSMRTEIQAIADNFNEIKVEC
jgi:hypothetical protein